MAARGRSREAAAESKGRKRPESVSIQVMREERDRLRAIVDAAVDGIIAIDEAGTILELNPAAERIFGYPAYELLGQNVSNGCVRMANESIDQVMALAPLGTPVTIVA